MAVANDYVTGTITLTNGQTTFTGTGTAWRLAGFRDGDRIYVDNLVAIIAPNSVTDPFIDSNTSGKLTVPWTGTTGTRTYRMSYKPDGARVTAETRNLIELLGNGNLETISELTPTTNAIIRGDASGTAWEKFTVSPFGFDFLGSSSLQSAAAAIGKAMVILVTGQSNATIEQPYVWTPPVNLKIWNYTKVAGNIGTAFVSPSGTVMSLALAYGRKLAIENPHRTIYIINIALGANSIGGWLPSVVFPDRDVYTDIVANVPPALVAAGATQIDAYVWWQVEGDKGALPAYPAKFETMMTRMRTNSWFKESTPTIVHGCSSNAISGDPTYGPCNKTLQAVVNADPQRRKFVYTASISTSLWTDTPKIHMTGAGYEQAGALGVDAYMGKTNGIQQQFVFDMDTPTGAPNLDAVGITSTVVGTTVAGVGTYTTNFGYSWRTGNRIDFLISLAWTAHTGTGSMVINTTMPPSAISIPFTCVAYFSGLTFTGQVLCRIVPSGGVAQIQMVNAVSNATSGVLAMDTAVPTLIVSGYYYVA